MNVIVTVRLPRNPAHNPHKKVVGSCPVNPRVICTDVTGEHHSVWVGDVSSFAEASKFVQDELGFSHITRVEDCS